jgi:hypothetical protein
VDYDEVSDNTRQSRSLHHTKPFTGSTPRSNNQQGLAPPIKWDFFKRASLPALLLQRGFWTFSFDLWLNYFLGVFS